ncbi:hypothetical protein MN608_02355 [Microdochium nivale]|nr:hypothetical protein MN608_02355 [Microdochium nivale]
MAALSHTSATSHGTLQTARIKAVARVGHSGNTEDCERATCFVLCRRRPCGWAEPSPRKSRGGFRIFMASFRPRQNRQGRLTDCFDKADLRISTTPDMQNVTRNRPSWLQGCHAPGPALVAVRSIAARNSIFGSTECIARSSVTAAAGAVQFGRSADARASQQGMRGDTRRHDTTRQ